MMMMIILLSYSRFTNFVILQLITTSNIELSYLQGDHFDLPWILET